MKSCIFIALNIVFITILLIVKSHCLPAFKSNPDNQDDNNVTVPVEDELVLDVHGVDNITGLLVDNSTDIVNNLAESTKNNDNKDSENDTTAKVEDTVHAVDVHVDNDSSRPTDLTNDSSVAGTKTNDKTELEKQPPIQEDSRKNILSGIGNVKAPLEEQKDLDAPVVHPPALNDRPKTLPAENVNEAVPIVETTTRSGITTTKVTPQENKKPLKEPVPVHAPVSHKTQGISDDPHPTSGQETVTPRSVSEVKPPDKKTPIEPADEKDPSGDEEQPDVALETDDKKEIPATIPDKKEPPKALPDPVDIPDKKVADATLPRPVFPEQENSHFFVYFMTVVAICVLGYFLFHNKQKIIALIVEGRHDRRRRSHSYRKLETEGTKGSPAIF